MTGSPHPHLVQRWKTCPVTVRAALLIPRDRRVDFVDWLLPHTPFRQEFVLRISQCDADVADLLHGIRALRFDCSVTGAIGCEIRFEAQGGVDPVYHCNGFRGIDLPDTVLAALVGMPLTRIVDHPFLMDLHFRYDEMWTMPQGPADDVDLGEDRAGGALLALADAQRQRMIEAARRGAGRGSGYCVTPLGQGKIVKGDRPWTSRSSSCSTSTVPSARTGRTPGRATSSTPSPPA